MALDPPGHGGIRVDDHLGEILCRVHRPHPREDRSHIPLFGFGCGKIFPTHFMALEAFEVDKDLPPRVMISRRYGKSPPFWRLKLGSLPRRTPVSHHHLLVHHHLMIVVSTAIGGLSAPPVQAPEHEKTTRQKGSPYPYSASENRAPIAPYRSSHYQHCLTPSHFQDIFSFRA